MSLKKTICILAVLICVCPVICLAGSQTYVTNTIGMTFVLIPRGDFIMGSPAGAQQRQSDERQHKVTITRRFYLQSTEVTQIQWKSIMGNNPSEFKGDNHPVENISWNDAKAFIEKLNRSEDTDKYRLPTEAEWEYACRAGSPTGYSFGSSDLQASAYAWYSSNSSKQTHPVAEKKPNAWGLYDMHGNVWEWCEDWYGDYPERHVTDPEGHRRGWWVRIFRGGAWCDDVRNIRSACRDGFEPGYKDYDVGFRVVRAY